VGAGLFNAKGIRMKELAPCFSVRISVGITPSETGVPLAATEFAVFHYN
jgi:hypothetical protein